MPSESIRQQPKKLLTWRARIGSICNLRLLLKLVYEASPGLLIASLCLRILRGFLPLVSLWVPKLILDSIVAIVTRHSADVARTWRLVAIEAGLVLLTDALGRVSGLVDNLLADGFTDSVSVRLMRHATTLDLSLLENPEFHDKLERARRQATRRMTVLSTSLGLGQDLLTLATLSSGLLAFSPWLVVLLTVAVLPAFFSETYFSAIAYSIRYRRTPQRRLLDYLRYLAVDVRGAKEIKIFGLGDYLVDRYGQIADDLRAEDAKLAVTRTATGAALNLVSACGYYGAYAVALGRALKGVISLGTFSFLAGCFSRSRMYIERILSGINDISEEAVFVKDLFDILEIQPSIARCEAAIPGPRTVRKGFEFRNVSFAYPGSDRPVISDVNLRLFPEETIALVGPNGAGKTTLVKLLARLYDPTGGQILLDGADLRDYDIADLRKSIGVVFQDYLRYDMLIRENIAFGNIGSMNDQTRIETAAGKSLANELIERLPGGYDQMVGRRFEGGVELSGGEWQKLALARAYMREAQLIILDEPTAALDARAEYEVFQRFAELSRGRMAVVISHRFSTVRMADRIMVLSNGSIREEGCHEELLALRGHYAELFSLQAQGYR